MEFGLSQDQKMMQDSVHRTLERAAPLARVREAAEANAIARDVHKALADLGVTGLLIPESFGGAGLKLLDAALVSETLGRHAAPVPFIAASVMAPLALIHAGSPEQQQRVLPKLAAGETIAGVAIAEVLDRAGQNADEPLPDEPVVDQPAMQGGFRRSHRTHCKPMRIAIVRAPPLSS